MRKQWLIAVAAALAVTTAAFVREQDAKPDSAAQDSAAAPAASSDAGVAGTQPIQFPHNLHAGQYQIPCMYCHFSAERSVDAGIPPVSTCMGCHRLIPGTTDAQKAEITKIGEFFNAGTQIPWNRLYKVADHVHFPHMRHVNAKTEGFPQGITCQTCHGQVQEMGVLTNNTKLFLGVQVGTTRAPEWGANNMGWCVSCHVKEEVSRDCTVCHY